MLKLGKRKLLTNNVLLLEIDKKGILIKKDFLNKKDLNKLKISQKETGVKTQKESFIKQALSNILNKIDDPLGKKRGSIK